MKKYWWIFAIIIILIVVCFNFGTFSFTYTKDSFDSLEKVEKMIGNDIREVTPIIDEFLAQYNKKDFKTSYENGMWVDELKKERTFLQFSESMNNVYNVFGNFISYDLEKAKITVLKDTKKNKRYTLYIPAEFEKSPKALIKAYLINQKGKIKIYSFYISGDMLK